MQTIALPIFPLATPALFPHCAAPLHVFEPRYRALVADALAGERLVGMATVRPEAVAAMTGDPPLYPVGCAGFIAEHQRLADGRYLMLLQATSRFRIAAEAPRPSERLYRVAEVELIEDPLGDEATVLVQRAAAMQELRALAAALGGETALDLDRLASESAPRFAGEVCSALRLPGAEKQALLEAGSAAERLERLAQTLSFYRALAATRGAGEATLH